MHLSPFHALYKARTLSSLAGRDKFVAAFASSDIEIYPYQVSAAMFALRSPFLKGAILCDDGSLGKSFEAMLIITQKWYEGKRRILIVVPTPLLHQWMKIIDERFSVPSISIDNNVVFNEQINEDKHNPFDQEGIVITTYNFAAEKAEYASQVQWDLSVFEEAHQLRRIHTGENKGAEILRNAVDGSFKLLLTATPMQNSIMDLYGLIYFIDEAALPDADSFYKRYFRKPEHYAELAERVSKFCFRTTRPQVTTYVKIPERIPMTVDFTPSKKEQQLAEMLDDYLARSKRYAFPKMELYDLTLMLTRNLSSSTFALRKTLQGVERRLMKLVDENNDAKIIDEHNHVKAMLTLTDGIKDNAKGVELLNALKKGFTEMRRLGAKKKVLIFTENRETQKYLYALLNDKGGYKGKVLMFNGDHSRDYTVMERFASDATILIATDIAAEGFNLEFCSFVVNYDLPYNTLKIEQRISRCHRQGQQSDVLVVNFLNRNNFADVRVLELINKRLIQYDGVIGLSDDVIGNLNVNINMDFGKIIAAARSKDEIDKAFDEILTDYEIENKQLVRITEQSLYTSFNKDLADSVTVSPQYLEKRIEELNDDLWAVTKYFFGSKHQFRLDDETRTVTCYGTPPKVFTGAAFRRYEYSMTKGYQPASGRHTIAGSLARNIYGEIFWIGIPDRGSVIVDAPLESCEIAYYRVKVKTPMDYFNAWYYNVFVGKTTSGHILSHDECVEIMALPVASFIKDSTFYGERDGFSNPKSAHEMDRLILPDEYTRRALGEMDGVVKEEIERLKILTQDKKIGLEQNIETLRSEVAALVNSTQKANSIAEKVQAEKKKTAATRELKQREQQLFMDGMRLDVEMEEQIQRLADEQKLEAEVKRQFVIRVEGNV